MRFKTWFPANLGDTRITKKFAIFPIRIDNEIRWLEFVRIKWELVEAYKFLPPCSPYQKWVKVQFVEESDEYDLHP